MIPELLKNDNLLRSQEMSRVYKVDKSFRYNDTRQERYARHLNMNGFLDVSPTPHINQVWSKLIRPRNKDLEIP